MAKTITINDIIRTAWNNRIAYDQACSDLIISREAEALLALYAEHPLKVMIPGYDRLLSLNVRMNKSDYLDDSHCPTPEQVAEANVKINGITETLTRIAEGKERVAGRWNPDTREYDYPLLEVPELRKLKQSFESSMAFIESCKLVDLASVKNQMSVCQTFRRCGTSFLSTL